MYLLGFSVADYLAIRLKFVPRLDRNHAGDQHGRQERERKRGGRKRGEKKEEKLVQLLYFVWSAN